MPAPAIFDNSRRPEPSGAASQNGKAAIHNDAGGGLFRRAGAEEIANLARKSQIGVAVRGKNGQYSNIRTAGGEYNLGLEVSAAVVNVRFRTECREKQRTRFTRPLPTALLYSTCLRKSFMLSLNRSARRSFSSALCLLLIAGSVAAAEEPQHKPGTLRRQTSGPSAEAPAGDELKEEEAAAPEYIRILRNDKRLADALQTSVVTFTKSDQYPGATVDLVGAIHLGEPGYYEELNSLFRNYDVLLFEAVMPEEAVRQGLRPGGGHVEDESIREAELESGEDADAWTDAKVGLTAISVLQLGMKDALGLEFQLSGINYAASNFVHADMTAEEFEQSMKQRGESFGQMFMQEIGKSITKTNQENPLAMNLDLMLSALAPDRMYRVRRIAAVQLAKAGEGEAFAGPDGTSTIITERNIKALEVLQRELKAGHKHIGVFYGAGHLADMEKRMREDLGFERSNELWLTAWDLRDDAGAEPAKK